MTKIKRPHSHGEPTYKSQHMRHNYVDYFRVTADPRPFTRLLPIPMINIYSDELAFLKSDTSMTNIFTKSLKIPLVPEETYLVSNVITDELEEWKIDTIIKTTFEFINTGKVITFDRALSYHQYELFKGYTGEMSPSCVCGFKQFDALTGLDIESSSTDPRKIVGLSSNEEECLTNHLELKQWYDSNIPYIQKYFR